MFDIFNKNKIVEIQIKIMHFYCSDTKFVESKLICHILELNQSYTSKGRQSSLMQHKTSDTADVPGWLYSLSN